jgi:hypothetical protein
MMRKRNCFETEPNAPGNIRVHVAFATVVDRIVTETGVKPP